MTKLLLTSTGLTNENITKEFLGAVNKPMDEVKIIFIPVAARNEEELMYVRKSKRELVDLGISEENIKTFNLDRPVLFEEVEDFDVIYVCGGNTFYLLKKVRETGFDKIIKQFVENDKLYFGVSAGSILVCPNIDIASPFDENDVNLTDLTGLNLTEVITSPHYCEEEKDIIDKFKEKSKYEVVTLTDNQGLLILNGEKKIIE